MGRQLSEAAAERAEIAAAQTQAELAIEEAAAGRRRQLEEELDATFVQRTSAGRLEAQRKELLQLKELFEAGRFGAPDTAEAQGAVTEEMKRVAGLTTEIKKTDDVARQLGLTFESAFEKAVLGGEDLSDVIREIGDDLLRLALRKSVTEPLFDLFTGLLSGAGGGAGIGSLLGGLFGFAQGGVMTNRGPLQLQRYASGGVAGNPTLAF